ncbi:MAG: hypothetical protein AB7F75_00650 [Planctomycetota bacterium]
MADMPLVGLALASCAWWLWLGADRVVKAPSSLSRSAWAPWMRLAAIVLAIGSLVGTLWQ